MTLSLEESDAWCHDLMRRAAGNFYYGMRLLPAPKRRAMHALYAWMRWIDDLADGPDDGRPDERTPQQIRALLEAWRLQTHTALAGGEAPHPILVSLAAATNDFGIPRNVFDEAIEGQLQDLSQSHYHTFTELYGYCYRVASTVGIAAACIWRYRSSEALKLAEYRGIAFQLTNILRDLREDAGRGRIYLPQEDLTAYGVTDVSQPSLALADLILFELERAQEYYDRSATLEALVAPDSRATLRIMTSIYHGLLRRIQRDPLAVVSERISLSSPRKLGEVVRQLYVDQKEAIDGEV